MNINLNFKNMNAKKKIKIGIAALAMVSFATSGMHQATAKCQTNPNGKNECRLDIDESGEHPVIDVTCQDPDPKKTYPKCGDDVSVL